MTDAPIEDGPAYPVHSTGETVPWSFLAPHEPQAIKNHGQTLKRLAERGGLAWSEILDIVRGNSWGTTSNQLKARADVLALLKSHEVTSDGT